MVNRSRWRRAALFLASTLLCANGALAEVSASIDRERIEANESFTLRITVGSTDNLAPDLSVLDEDFEIGQTTQLTEAHIVLGEVQRSVTWTIVLSPRRSGELTIPPISVGGEQSQPLSISVVEPAYEPPGEADVFLSSEVDFDETYVQAQVLYRIRIYRAVATRQPVLREPVFAGAEVLVEPASAERNYEAVLNGRAYNVSEYVFAVFPQESGEISISPAKFEARVLRDGRITGRKVFESDAHTIRVNAIPPPPPDHPDAAWLPAREVTLRDAWSREPDRLKAGEPISRDITISALGQLETQVPVIEPPVVDGVNVYPDRPVLSRELETEGIRGVRTDQYAMIGVAGGEVTLPELELPWFDIDAGEWRIASLPAQTLTILPPPASAEPPPAPVATDRAPVDEAVPATEVVYSGFWRQVAALLAIAWAATAFAWWWSSRPRRAEREPPAVPLHRQQAKHLKAARKAALDGDARGLRQALRHWSELQWPERPPRSVGELATRVSQPLADELVRLSRASYGNGEVRWNGAAMAKALRSFAVRGDDRARGPADALPPLMPG